MSDYIIMKFGGTSVGGAARLKEVFQLIKEEQRPKIVVLSAMAGTTNALHKYAHLLYAGQIVDANKELLQLEKYFEDEITKLFDQEDIQEEAKEFIQKRFQGLRAFIGEHISTSEENIILAEGEIISTALLAMYAKEREGGSCLISALDYMTIDDDREPDIQTIRSFFTQLFIRRLHQPKRYFIITQGFICRDSKGAISNLQRGGSDYTASLIGAAINAKEVQIWTDVNGLQNNDPRIISNTYSVRSLTYDEAAELAYFGAKVLHPASIHPAKLRSIPVRILNTMNPVSNGTLINNNCQERGIVKAIAAKDGITAIKIHSSRMLMAYGFLNKVFAVFERYKTPIDLVTTSEVAISVSIDNDIRLNEILRALSFFSTTEMVVNQTIICVVGQDLGLCTGIAGKVFNALQDIPIEMISFGGSNHNIGLLIDSCNKERALQILHRELFLRPVLELV